MNEWFVSSSIPGDVVGLYMKGIDGNMYAILAISIADGARVDRCSMRITFLLPLAAHHFLTRAQRAAIAFMNANPNIIYDPLWDHWTA